MGSIRVSRDFAKLSPVDLSAFAGTVIAGFTDNPDLPDPPEPVASLTATKTALDDAIVASKNGGKLKIVLRNTAAAVLVDALEKDASYVDIRSAGDLAILLSSGFEPVSTNRTQEVLQAPVIRAVSNGPQSGQIHVRVKGDANRKGIQGRIKAVGGEFGPAITFKNARQIVFDGLVAGTTYVMQLIGIGGSTGQSDWSEEVTKVAQ